MIPAKSVKVLPATPTETRWRSPEIIESDAIATKVPIQPELNTSQGPINNNCITMPEVIIGEIPNSIRVPRLDARITRIQYKGSALFDCNIPYKGIWQQTKQMPCRDLLFWRAADLLNHVVLVRREILLVHLAHRRIDLLLALQLPCFSLLVPLDYLRW